MCIKRWSVCKREGKWRIIDRDTWHDTCDTLAEAHTYATQLAVADRLFSAGGLTCLRVLVESYWAHDDFSDWQDWLGNGRLKQDIEKFLPPPKGSIGAGV